MKKILFASINLISFLMTFNISGVVIDDKNSEPISGCNVFILDDFEEIVAGNVTDADGFFYINNIQQGSYEFRVSHISYKTYIKKTTINQDVILNIRLDNQPITFDEISIIGTITESNEITKIKDQKESGDIINSLSFKEIKKSGDSNALGALKRITGVTIVEGKNDVIIRGLGDRYSQARVNSVTMPSTDPDKRNLPLNLFPTKIIDKIDVYKSYHPKLPGNFAGGSVDVVTKSYPDEFTIKFSISNSHNSELNINQITLPNNGYVNPMGDYSQFDLDLSNDRFGSNYIFETTPAFFSDYHETNGVLEDQIFDQFLYDSNYGTMDDISANFNIIDNQGVWESFYFNKLSDNLNSLSGSYQRSKINNSDLQLFGVPIPQTPLSLSFMNGNKYEFSNSFEYGYFINVNYSNKYGTHSENISEYAKVGDLYRSQYSLIQNKNSFNTNFSNLVTAGIKYDMDNDNFFKLDYNYMDIRTSKNEAMSIISDQTYYELDNGGVSLTDKISQKTINSHHLILSSNYNLNQFIKINFDTYYNESKSELSMPDMKQQTYHKNIFTSNGVWDESEDFIDINNNNNWDESEQFTDLGNGIWDEGESFTDLGNGIWDADEPFIDSGIQGHGWTGSNNGIWDFIDSNDNGICEQLLGINPMFPNIPYWECETWNDATNGVWDEGEPFTDLGNGLYDFGEPFVDYNGNGVWDDAEIFIDSNGDGLWNDEEDFEDSNGNGVWDEGESFTDDRVDYVNEKYRYLSLIQGEGENGVKPTKRTWVYGGENQQATGFSSNIKYQFNEDLNVDFLFGYEDLSKDRSFSKREFTLGTNSQNTILSTSDIVFDPSIIYPGYIFDDELFYFDLQEGSDGSPLNVDGLYMMESSSLAGNNSYTASENTYSTFFLFTVKNKNFSFLKTLTASFGLRYEDYQLNMQPYNTVTGEYLWRNADKNNIYDIGEEYNDINQNGQYDVGESFVDLDNDGAWNPSESFTDSNENGLYDNGESFIDLHPILIIDADKNEQMVLPVVNLIFSPNELFNYRLSFSQTLARPQYRELAPTKYEEFYSDRAVEGNPYLKTTRIKNFDFRFEYYPKLSNMYSIGIYKKEFTNPIALVIRPGSSHNYISYANSKSADVFGIEFEFMTKLDFVPYRYGYFSLGSNLSFNNSSTKSYDTFVSYMGDTLADISNAKERPMMGQSDLIFNGNIGWSNRDNTLELNLSYNYYSERLIYVGAGESPDEYEYPKPDLNFTSKYKIKGMEFSFKIQNMLNSETKLGAEYDNVIYYTRKYKPGVGYSFNVSYGF